MAEDQPNRAAIDSDDPELSRKGPLAWMTLNSVAANLLMMFLIVGGLINLGSIKQEVFPEFDLDLVTITVPYPGASPAEVEQGVVLAIEEEVRGLDGIKEIRSYANESAALVTVELLAGSNSNKVLSDIKSAVDRIASFPEDAERPIVSLATMRNQVITVAIFGDQSEKTLRLIAEEMREELLDLPDITTVELAGVRPYEISIEVPPENLRRYNLTLSQIAQRISAASIELPAGAVKTARGDILLRTTERAERGADFGDIVLLSRPDGTQVRVNDIATVKDTFQETNQEAYFNGQRAALINVFRIGDETPIEVAAAAKKYIAEKKGELPDSIHVTTMGDASEVYQDRIDLLLRNGYLGLALVLLTLGAFLEIRLAFWVTMGIPISFIGALLLMPGADVSINMISLFAFIVVLGIVVDDAIVVGESIFYYRHKGMSFIDAAIKGVRQVAVPVVFAVLTSIAAFSPLLFVPGVSGKFFRVMPLVVILVLILSLVESLLILPAHLAHAKAASSEGWKGWFHRQQQKFTHGLLWFIEHVYKPQLITYLNHRYVTLAIAGAVFIAAVGVVAGGHLRFTFMPRIASDRVITSLEMPVGTPIEETKAAQARVMRGLEETLASIDEGEAVLEGVFSQVGDTGAGTFGPQRPNRKDGGNMAETVVYMVSADQREIDADDFAERWRKNVQVPGAESLLFKYTTGPGASAPIDIELSHPSTEVLEKAADELADAYGSFQGVKDIDDGIAPGKEQIDIELKPAGRSLGLTEIDLARQVRSAYFGAEAVRQQRGRDEVRTYVRLPEENRQSEYSLEEFLVRTPSGQEIPLNQAAKTSRGRSYTQIMRVEGRRTVNVTADVTREGNANEIMASVKDEVLPKLMAKYPQLSWAPGGQQRDQQETFSALGRNFMFALIAIFTLLAIPFRSYSQPLIILSAVPFGFVGAVIGHLLLGYDMSMISMMGIVALSGVVVNDSLVLVHAVNAYREEENLSIFDAVIAGATRRFRPILLTSLTTFFGLMPMILETSIQAKFLIPMAVSLGFGVIFSTGITLVVVPALYVILYDVKARGAEAADAVTGARS